MSTHNDAATVTGHADPEGEAPWAMQLVVRAEKSDPPTRTAVLEAAAMAVVQLVDKTDEAFATVDVEVTTNLPGLTVTRASWANAAPEAKWKWRVERWLAGRIRKHVRRARGAKWEKVQALPGVTVEHAGAQVRAFVPTSVEDIYPDVAKLQLSGRDLDDPDPHGPLEPEQGVLAVAVSADTAMSWTKQAAATGHAAQIARMRMPAETLEQWRASGFAVRVEQPDVARWRQLVDGADVTVVDAGFTFPPQRGCESAECEPVTAVARWS